MSPCRVGAQVTITGAAQEWSYPGVLGHTVATGDGTSTGALQLCDPYGQPLDPTTRAIGTVAADDGNTVEGRTGWHQGAQKLAHTTGSVTVIQMGARLYVPALGRFLNVDPVEGGVDNAYVWPTDPIGKNDLSGKFIFGLVAMVVAAVVAVVAAPKLIRSVAASSSKSSSASSAAYTPASAPAPDDSGEEWRGAANTAAEVLKYTSFALSVITVVAGFVALKAKNRYLSIPAAGISRGAGIGAFVSGAGSWGLDCVAHDWDKRCIAGTFPFVMSSALFFVAPAAAGLVFDSHIFAVSFLMPPR